MGSFKSEGRDQGPNRRRGIKHKTKRSGFPKVEVLEELRLLSGGGGATGPFPAPYWTPTSTNIGDIRNGPMANMGQDLIHVYQSYLSHQGQVTSLAAEFPWLQFQGSS